MRASTRGATKRRFQPCDMFTLLSRCALVSRAFCLVFGYSGLRHMSGNFHFSRYFHGRSLASSRRFHATQHEVVGGSKANTSVARLENGVVGLR